MRNHKSKSSFPEDPMPTPHALGTEVELRTTNGTTGGKPHTRIQRGHVTDRVFFYELGQWGYAVRWYGAADCNLGAFVIEPMLEVV
jgi:hypothetical protein